MEVSKYPRSFEELKRDFEIAYSNGEDYTELLYTLAKVLCFWRTDYYLSLKIFYPYILSEIYR